MCGRFVAAWSADDIVRWFSVDEVADDLPGPRWNVAPTDEVAVVTQVAGTRRLEVLHWGLVPAWAKDPSIGNRMINARVETVATNNAFSKALSSRRCVVPADGFYEWTAGPGGKGRLPWFIHRPDGEPLALAGLWEEWRDRHGDGVLRSCTIVTGPATDDVSDLHDRMPVLLDPARRERWLDEAVEDTDELGALLGAVPAGLVVRRPVSTEVNNVRSEGAHLLEDAEHPSAAGAPTGELDGQRTLM